MNGNIDQICNKIPFVSIIVPIFKTERYLRQCVNSLLFQTLKNIEIILVDDESPDNCPEICNVFAENDTRVKVIHQKNGGYGKACNAGFEISKGEYLCIIESDDYVELNMFELLYNIAKLHNLDVIRSHYYYYKSLENIHTRVDLSFIPNNIILTPLENQSIFYQEPAIWAMIYRSDMIKNNKIKFLETPGASFQDTSFAFKIYTYANRFMLIEDALIHYRIDNENSSINSKEKMFCVCYEYKEIEHFVKEREISNLLKYTIPKAKYACYMWNYKRITMKYSYNFLKVFSRELRIHIKEKSLIRSNFTLKEYLKIIIIVFMYPLYHIKQYFNLK